MTFNFFGFDFFLEDRLIGFWLCSTTNYDGVIRSLFGVYYDNRRVIFELLWFNLGSFYI